MDGRDVPSHLPMTILNQLNQLESAGLIHPVLAKPELEYLFRHVLVQDAAYESLLRQDRKRLHRAAGLVLERTYPDRLEEIAPLLGEHFYEAGDHSRALRYFTLAADRAANRYANAEAAMLYERAIELTRHTDVSSDTLIDLHVKYGRILELSGKYDTASAIYNRLEQLGQQRNDSKVRLAALIQSATIRSVPTAMFNPEQAQALSERALALTHELGDPKAEAKILWNLSLVHYFTGHYPEAVQFGEQSLALAQQHNLREQMAYTLEDLASSYAAAGQIDRSLAILEEARPLWRELHNLPMLANSMNSAASSLHLVGKNEQALSLAHEALTISRQIGNAWGQSYSLMGMSLIYFERADFTMAMEAMRESIRLGDTVGFLVAQISMRSILAIIYMMLGTYDQCFELARQLLAMQHLAGYRLWGNALLVIAYSVTGELDRAESALREAVDEYKRGMPLPLTDEFIMPMAEIELAMAHREYAQVIQKLDGYIASFRASGARDLIADMLHRKGQALLALGRATEAREALNDARVEAESKDMRRILWMILGELGMVEARLGRHAEANDLQAQARALILDIAARLDNEELRASFLGTLAVRRIFGSPGLS